MYSSNRRTYTAAFTYSDGLDCMKLSFLHLIQAKLDYYCCTMSVVCKTTHGPLPAMAVPYSNVTLQSAAPYSGCLSDTLATTTYSNTSCLWQFDAYDRRAAAQPNRECTSARLP